MKRNDDIELVLEQWFMEGPQHMSDRLFDGTLDQIERLPRGRLVDLRLRLPAMNLNVRLAAAAALVIALAGAGMVLVRLPSVGPAPSPTTSPTGTSDPSIAATAVSAALHGWWSAVGDRVSPADWGPTDNTFNVTSTGLAIEQLHGNVLSSWSVIEGGSGLVVRWEREVIGSFPANQRWGCQVGDEGVYTVRLSEDGATLTLTLGLVSDPCAPRAVFLAGDWMQMFRTLGAGQYVSSVFRPFPAPSTIRLGYTVPEGWTLPLPAETFMSLVRGTAPDEMRIDLRSNLSPYHEAAVGPLSSIGEATSCADIGEDVAGTSAAIASWLASLPAFVASTPTSLTIDRHVGMMVDLALTPGSIDPCAPTESAVVATTFVDRAGGSPLGIAAGHRVRYILFDQGLGQCLVIAVDATDATWDEAIAAAMPIIESFEFTRP